MVMQPIDIEVQRAAEKQLAEIEKGKHIPHEEYMKMRMKEEQYKDTPTDPAHYNTHTIEPIAYIMANDLDFCEGNIVKYVSRWRLKNGITDLRKARQYLDFLIKQEENGSPL